MSRDDYHVGDKFIIEVGHHYWCPNVGNRYFIKGFDTLVFDDKGLDRLTKYKAPPQDPPHSCEFCRYESVGIEEYPCILCDKNRINPKDMFRAKDE